MGQFSWMDAKLPDRGDIVLRYVLEKWEADRPQSPLAVFFEGDTWSYADAAHFARQTATAFAHFGVGRGDRVMCWLPNGGQILKCWFGANWLGAVYTPVNTAYRGALLAHVIEISEPKIVVCHSAFLDRLEEVGLDPTIPVVLVDIETSALPPSALNLQGCERLKPEIELSRLELSAPIEPWETQSIIFTSGTTGPSKGVLSSYCHGGTSSMVAFEAHDCDRLRYLITLPLFHAGGTLGVMGMMLLGRSFVMSERFETKRFWDMVRSTETTCCTLLGTMETFLLKEPVTPHDQDHTLEWAYVVPHTAASRDFGRRFDVLTRTLFNMSEVSIPIISDGAPGDPASCGRIRPGVELRIADEHDQAVPEGSVGELLIRSDRPWAISHGYIANPEATAQAWRNGWFHTGDLFRRSNEGDYFFVDRAKDCIRRRGENISSFEVEQECLAHPSIREAAAIGVPSEFGEDDLLVVVSPVEGRRIEPLDLLEFLRQRSPYYMVPRFIQVMDSLPKTPTEKIQKTELRDAGVTPDTWDREAHGIRVKSERIPNGA